MLPLAYISILLLALISVGYSQIDSCESSDLSTFIPSTFNASGLNCKPIWSNFILRYSQDQDYILSIVLSAVYTSGWIGVGFSNDGMMIGSSAMVGFIGRGGRAHIKQYYLRGQSTSQVVVNEGQLLSSDVAPQVVLYGVNMYLVFQLQFSAPVSRKNLLFAYSTATPDNYQLTEHNNKISISFDFSGGPPATSAYPYKLKRNHGALTIFGWGVLLPVGAIIARYCKKWDPLWYFLHVIVQFAGFIVGFAGIMSGIELYDQLHSDVFTHRGFGIFVFVLVILQVIAFFIHPEKESKIRRYWNWYHHWVGRLALCLASVNIVLGIHVGGAGPLWKVGYGISLALILAAAFVLEVLSWARGSEKSAEPSAF